MSLEILGFLFLLVLLSILPFLGSIIELRRPRDDQPLLIQSNFLEEPRRAGLEFRKKLDLSLTETKLEHLRCGIRDSLGELHLPAKTHRSDLLVWFGNVKIGQESQIAEAYVRGDAQLERNVRLKAMACDGEVTLAPGCRIEDWLDAEGNIWVGKYCNLGLSASSSRVLYLNPGCSFKRLWGLPISTAAFVSNNDEFGPDQRRMITIQDAVVWGNRWLSLPQNFVLERDVVAYGDVHIGAGSIIQGSVKAHGAIYIGKGAKVAGNLIAREDIHIAQGSHIDGNVFSEGDIFTAACVKIGQPMRFRSVYSARRIILSSEVQIFGWVIAEYGGYVK